MDRADAQHFLDLLAARGWHVADGGTWSPSPRIVARDEVLRAAAESPVSGLMGPLATEEVADEIVELQVLRAMRYRGGIAGIEIARAGALTNAEVGRALQRLREKGQARRLGRRFRRRPRPLWFATAAGHERLRRTEQARRLEGVR